MVHGSPRIARDRQDLGAIQGAHVQIDENEDATQASGVLSLVRANTSNTAKISWNGETMIMQYVKYRAHTWRHPNDTLTERVLFVRPQRKY